MDTAFPRIKGALYAEGVSVEALAEKYGTPLYVYSLGHVLDQYRRLTAAFAPLDHLVCYSLKANASLGLLGPLAAEGCGFDIVSGGELHRVLKAGGDPSKVIFAGVGKTESELEFAVRRGIYMFNIESWPEAELLDSVAKRLRKKVRADFRINPEVEAGAHHKISTARKTSKFGLPHQETLALFKRAAGLRNLEITGIHLHIGSQITELAPFKAATSRALDLIGRLRKSGFKVETLNLGGGLGIVYDREAAKTPEEYAAALLPMLKDARVKVILEPGRSFVGNAGVLVAKVQYVKETRWKDFVIVDAAMNDLIRPSLYEAYHAVEPVREPTGRKKGTYDVVGPICESGDFLAQGRRLAEPRRGELLAVRSAGAYGMAMASNYNQRGRAAEVVVSGSKHWLTRRRETWDDLLRGESLPPSSATRAKGGKP
jgi:diaminopimelate decarboxylase